MTTIQEQVETPQAPVTEIGQHQLDRYEARIERVERDYCLIRGGVLKKIRDRRLYRPQYRTFDEYCEERWGISPRQAQRLITEALNRERAEASERAARRG